MQLLPRRSVRLCCMASRSDRRAGADQPPACRRVVVLVGPVLFCTVGSVRLGWLGWLGYERSVRSSAGVPAEVSRNNRGAVPEERERRAGGERKKRGRLPEPRRKSLGVVPDVSRSRTVAAQSCIGVFWNCSGLLPEPGRASSGSLSEGERSPPGSSRCLPALRLRGPQAS